MNKEQELHAFLGEVDAYMEIERKESNVVFATKPGLTAEDFDEAIDEAESMQELADLGFVPAGMAREEDIQALMDLDVQAGFLAVVAQKMQHYIAAGLVPLLVSEEPEVLIYKARTDLTLDDRDAFERYVADHEDLDEEEAEFTLLIPPSF